MRENLVEEHANTVENQRKMLFFSLIFGAIEATNIKKVYATSTRFTFLIKIKVNFVAETETFFIFVAHLKFTTIVCRRNNILLSFSLANT